MIQTLLLQKLHKSIPPIPIFITATLSDRTPANPANAIGVALTTVACSIPVSEKDFPAVAHTKKHVIKRKNQGQI